MEDRKLKALFLSEYFFPYTPGGSEWSVYYLAKHLVKKKIEVGVYTPKYGNKSEVSIDGIRVFRFWTILPGQSVSRALSPFWHSNLVWWLSSTLLLLRAIKNFRPTHLHIQSKYLLPAGVVVGKLLRIPTIVTLRDYVILCPHAYCIRGDRKYQACTFWELIHQEYIQAVQKQNVKGFVYKVLLFFATIRGWWVGHMLKYFLRRADYVVGISRKLTLIYRHNQIRVDEVIYNAMEFRKLRVKKQNYWLFAGRRTWGKGIELLLSAYANIGKKKSIPRLYVIGQGIGGSSTQSPNVKFIPHVSHTKYLEYLKRAQLVIMPSQWEEPFGRVALEALSQGTPVLVTHRGGLPEIVQHNKTGVIVEPTVKGLTDGFKLFLQTRNKIYTSLHRELPSLKQKFFNEPLASHMLLYQKL